MRTLEILAVVAITAMCVAGCGETAKFVETVVGSSCPMTIEEDIYIPASIVEDELESLTYEWESNPETYVEVEEFLDGAYEVRVFEQDCNTHTYYYGTV